MLSLKAERGNEDLQYRPQFSTFPNFEEFVLHAGKQAWTELLRRWRWLSTGNTWTLISGSPTEVSARNHVRIVWQRTMTLSSWDRNRRFDAIIRKHLLLGAGAIFVIHGGRQCTVFLSALYRTRSKQRMRHCLQCIVSAPSLQEYWGLYDLQYLKCCTSYARAEATQVWPTLRCTFSIEINYRPLAEDSVTWMVSRSSVK